MCFAVLPALGPAFPPLGPFTGAAIAYRDEPCLFPGPPPPFPSDAAIDLDTSTTPPIVVSSSSAMPPFALLPSAPPPPLPWPLSQASNAASDALTAPSLLAGGLLVPLGTQTASAPAATPAAATAGETMQQAPSLSPQPTGLPQSAQGSPLVPALGVDLVPPAHVAETLRLAAAAPLINRPASPGAASPESAVTGGWLWTDVAAAAARAALASGVMSAYLLAAQLGEMPAGGTVALLPPAMAAAAGHPAEQVAYPPPPRLAGTRPCVLSVPVAVPRLSGYLGGPLPGGDGGSINTYAWLSDHARAGLHLLHFPLAARAVGLFPFADALSAGALQWPDIATATPSVATGTHPGTRGPPRHAAVPPDTSALPPLLLEVRGLASGSLLAGRVPCFIAELDPRRLDAVPAAAAAPGAVTEMPHPAVIQVSDRPTSGAALGCAGREKELSELPPTHPPSPPLPGDRLPGVLAAHLDSVQPPPPPAPRSPPNVTPAEAVPGKSHIPADVWVNSQCAAVATLPSERVPVVMTNDAPAATLDQKRKPTGVEGGANRIAQGGGAADTRATSTMATVHESSHAVSEGLSQRATEATSEAIRTLLETRLAQPTDMEPTPREAPPGVKTAETSEAASSLPLTTTVPTKVTSTPPLPPRPPPPPPSQAPLQVTTAVATPAASTVTVDAAMTVEIFPAAPSTSTHATPSAGVSPGLRAAPETGPPPSLSQPSIDATGVPPSRELPPTPPAGGQKDAGGEPDRDRTSEEGGSGGKAEGGGTKPPGQLEKARAWMTEAWRAWLRDVHLSEMVSS